MKKTFIALLAAIAISGIPFAENYTKGLDISAGILLASSKTKISGQEETKMKAFQITMGKIDTYDCFLFHDIFGIYASFGVNMGRTWDSKHSSFSKKPVNSDLSFDFAFGPAIGFNLGRVRFQTGLAFHGSIDKTKIQQTISIKSAGINSLKLETKSTGTAFGFALTPQFRFSADKRCSFVVGTDIIFDSPKKSKYETKVRGYSVSGNSFKKSDWENKGTTKAKSATRVEFRPYIGIGFNF